jgi:polar amino acid transport system substrate-binding protein
MKLRKIIFCSLFFANTLSAAQPEVLKVCYDQWPPMTMYPSDQDSRRGFVIEMLSDIYKDAGYELDFYAVPLGRGIDMVSSGTCDLLPENAYSPNEEAGYVFAEKASFEYPMAFIVRKDDDWKYEGIKSLENRRVATGPGWDYSSMSVAYQSYLDDPDNSADVETMTGENDVVNRILNMIVANRIDLYADNLLVLKHTLNETGLSEQLKVVMAGAEYKLIEKPIFSKKIPIQKRLKLIKIWDEGRSKIDSQKENYYLKKYGINLPEDANSTTME